MRQQLGRATIHRVDHARCYFFDAAPRVDDFAARRLADGDGQIAFAHAAMELQIFAFQPALTLQRRRRAVARSRPFDSRSLGEVEDQRQVIEDNLR